MSEKQFYFIDPTEWDEKTAHLPLELEAAYLRLTSFCRQHGRTDVAGRWNFQAMFRCGASRARSLLKRLAAAGFVQIVGEDSVRVLGVRLSRTPISLATRAEVFARDGFVCAYCSSEAGPFDIDHIHPVVRGGNNALSNLAVACASCNRSKGSKFLSEWL